MNSSNAQFDDVSLILEFNTHYTKTLCLILINYSIHTKLYLTIHEITYTILLITVLSFCTYGSDFNEIT